MKYISTIGLEIHAELSTKTKMFCDCLNDPGESRPNFNVCEVCLAHPGALPTINEVAVDSVIKLGLALGAEIPKFSKFDRKNYFYPDLPKGYQLSQYDEPLVKGGNLAGIKITRVHLEEDTGRIIHDKEGNSLINYNRAGRPLMELVTEPVIHSSEEALIFAKELQTLLRYLNISRADMENGEMRVEANISISAEDGKLGTKVEVKNLNSFRAVAGAIAYEIKRQEESLESGEKIVQETRGWDDIKKQTYSQRLKEEAHDYRYMPEPDLPPLVIKEDRLARLKIALPELPNAKRSRFAEEYKLKPEQIEILINDRGLAQYYEEVISELREELPDKWNAELAFNYLSSDLLGLMGVAGVSIDKVLITPEDFADLVALVIKGEISSRVAKDILEKMFERGGDPREIMKSENLAQISDETELKKMVDEIYDSMPDAVVDYKKGKVNALQAMIGRAMGKLRGRGNPEVLRKLFLDKLK